MTSITTSPAKIVPFAPVRLGTPSPEPVSMAKPQSVAPGKAERTYLCHCPICNQGIYKGDSLADHAVWETNGDLDYYELAHLTCAQNDSNRDYWNWNGKPLTDWA